MCDETKRPQCQSKPERSAYEMCTPLCLTSHASTLDQLAGSLWVVAIGICAVAIIHCRFVSLHSGLDGSFRTMTWSADFTHGLISGTHRYGGGGCMTRRHEWYGMLIDRCCRSRVAAAEFRNMYDVVAIIEFLLGALIRKLV